MKEMEVLVTLDYYDGSQSKFVECDPEDVPARELMLRLMQRDVCGYTVTKVRGILKTVSLTEASSSAQSS